MSQMKNNREKRGETAIEDGRHIKKQIKSIPNIFIVKKYF